MFSKQHYKAIASIIKESTMYTDDRESNFTVIPKVRLVTELCHVFQEDNPLFDKEKFSKACGLG